MKFAYISFQTLLLFFSAKLCFAQEVYRWTDKHGKTHFSTTPPNTSAEPAKLPQIKRENQQKIIEDMKKSTPKTCNAHGGIDCPSGKDKDGSVICLDGYKDAVMQYNSYCLETKINTVSFKAIDEDQQPIEDLSQAGSGRLLLIVRNDSSVEAKAVNVSFKTPFNDEVSATGPKQIAPFSIGEYQANFSDFKDLKYTKILEKVIFSLSCENCPNVSKGKLD